MKKFMTDIKTMAALFIAGVAMTACSSDDNFEQQPENPAQKTYTMTVNASKGDDAMTRALALDESGEKNVRNATWTEGEVILVYQLRLPQRMISVRPPPSPKVALRSMP